MEIIGENLYKEIQDIVEEHIETKLNNTSFTHYGKYDSKKMFACVGGGSVADRLYTHNTGKELPIKDIDVFVGNLWGTKSNDGEEYNGVQSFINKKNNVVIYNIYEVIWDGKINIIGINLFEPCLNEDEFVQYVIRGFDLNCCQAAISMNNKKIFTTPEYDTFLKTRDLKITNPHNMASTALRIIKKKNLFGNVDVERELDIICNAYYYYQNKMTMNNCIRKNNPKAEHLEDIKTHFNVTEDEHYYIVIPREEKNILHLENLETKKTYSFVNNFLTFDEIREMYERKKKELQ